MGGWAYMLRCSDDSYYVGSTSHRDVETRVIEHNEARYEGYTSARRPVTLVWADWFDDLRDAHAKERQLKGWTRAKKDALIRRNYLALHLLAKRPQVRPKVPMSRVSKHALVINFFSPNRPPDAPDRHPEVRSVPSNARDTSLEG